MEKDKLPFYYSSTTSFFPLNDSYKAKCKNLGITGLYRKFVLQMHKLLCCTSAKEQVSRIVNVETKNMRGVYTANNNNNNNNNNVT